MATSTASRILDREAIKKILPHRGPALLIDNATVNLPTDDGSVQVPYGSCRYVVPADRCEGHFPDEPVFPGHLQQEIFNQLAGVVAGVYLDVTGGQAVVRRAEARFESMAHPGDKLHFMVTNLVIRANVLILVEGEAAIATIQASEFKTRLAIIKPSA